MALTAVSPVTLLPADTDVAVTVYKSAWAGYQSIEIVVPVLSDVEKTWLLELPVMFTDQPPGAAWPDM